MLSPTPQTDIRFKMPPVHARPAGRQVPSAGESALFGLPELTGATINYDRNTEIYGEGEPSEYVYKVIRGAVRSYRVLSDGRRQINAFYLFGDVFGLEAGDEHSTSVEALSDTTVAIMPRKVLHKSAKQDGAVAMQVCSLTASELARAQNHALLLIKSAQERVAAFLLEMAGRLGGDESIELPMSRQDIADHLGLTIETVSRTLTQLATAATIEFHGSRRIVLRNQPALRLLNG